MNRLRFYALIFALTGIFALAWHHVYGGEEKCYKAYVHRVIDGDTMEVWAEIDMPSAEHRGQFVMVRVEFLVRLAGIDAWETRGAEKAKGMAAKLRAIELVADRWVLLATDMRRGKYGRLIGRIVLLDGRDLGEILVEEGHAARRKY